MELIALDWSLDFENSFSRTTLSRIVNNEWFNRYYCFAFIRCFFFVFRLIEDPNRNPFPERRRTRRDRRARVSGAVVYGCKMYARTRRNAVAVYPVVRTNGTPAPRGVTCLWCGDARTMATPSQSFVFSRSRSANCMVI